MRCPICGQDMTSHTDADCIIPLLNYVKQLERIAELSRQRVLGEADLDTHQELKQALETLDAPKGKVPTLLYRVVHTSKLRLDKGK